MWHYVFISHLYTFIFKLLGIFVKYDLPRLKKYSQNQHSYLSFIHYRTKTDQKRVSYSLQLSLRVICLDMLECRIKFRKPQQILTNSRSLKHVLKHFQGLDLKKSNSFRIFSGLQFSCWYFFVNFTKLFRKAFYNTSPDDFFYKANQTNIYFGMAAIHVSQLKNNQQLGINPNFFILKQKNMRTLAPFLLVPLHTKVM